MLLSSWPQNSKRSATAARRHTQTTLRQRASFRPRLEALEDRCLFSTLTVTSLQDSGAGSLRGQIAAAQSGDTIVFASTLTSASTATSVSKLTSVSTLSSAFAPSRSLKSSKGHGHGNQSPPPPPPPPPTSTKTITLASGELLLTKNLSIQGPGAALLKISGSGSRAFEVAQGTTVTLSGLAIGGSSSYWTAIGSSPGGAILNHGALTVSACTVSGSVFSPLGRGGGIFNDGTLNVIGSTVTNCRAEGSAGSTEYGNETAACGAGIANVGTATLTNTIISNNRAAETTSYPWFNKGGGIFNQGTMTLTGCTVSGNYSQRDAGGIFNEGALLLSGCTVSGNVASLASGIYNAATMTVQNSTSITDVYNFGVLQRDSTSTIGILVGNAAILI